MRVLVVEDDPTLARSIAVALEEHGFEVEIALDGDEGLSLGSTRDIDVVVLDLLLPERAGLDVLAGLKARKPLLPILVLTALGGVEHRVAGLDRGADDYMEKPFALLELLARVRALLRRQGVVAVPAIIEVDDLVVDVNARIARRADRIIALTQREYELLVLFMTRRGEILSRMAIGEHVVDRGFRSNSNIIDVSVCGLRMKLGTPDLIETVRGVGYRFASGSPRRDA